jgi:hypothetical protein
MQQAGRFTRAAVLKESHLKQKGIEWDRLPATKVAYP